MPVSHRYKVIFVHVPRTAGSSISQVLGICGDDNKGALTPARPDMLYGLVGNKVLQHLTARGVREKLGRDVYERYFKFTFVRNPFDRVVSTYHVRKKLLPHVKMSFRDFVLNRIPQRDGGGLRTLFKSKAEKALEDQFDAQYEYIFDEKGKGMVDFIGRYETVDADFKVICRRLGIPGDLPQLNESVHERDYRLFYDEQTRAAVQAHYKRDLETFQYHF